VLAVSGLSAVDAEKYLLVEGVTGVTPGMEAGQAPFVHVVIGIRLELRHSQDLAE
jgi:hypothetical protein